MTIFNLNVPLECTTWLRRRPTTRALRLRLVQEICQAVEQLSPRLAALSTATRRLGECQQLEEDVVGLKEQQQGFTGKAAEKQSTLESLLALWQRYKKQPNTCYGCYITFSTF